MKKYIITIKEILEKKVEIEANSKEEAIKIIEDRYNNEKIVLDSSNFKEVFFK